MKKKFHHAMSYGQFYITNKPILIEDGIHFFENDYVAYYENGKLHREDGPAFSHHNGQEEWWLNGKRHRVGGPAMVDPIGSKAWRQHGLLHREDGPARIRHNGKIEWWLRGNEYGDINEWGKALGIYDTDEFTMIKLQWG